MRLRELKYPLVVLNDSLLMGGKNAGLATKHRWNANVSDHYIKGGYDEALIIDSVGRKFEVKRIYLSSINPLQKILSYLIYAGKASERANIDMDLNQIGKYTLPVFCDAMRHLALDHPTWWERHSSRQEIAEMFKGCSTFKDAINDIGVLDPPEPEKLKGYSEKVVDLRRSAG